MVTSLRTLVGQGQLASGTAGEAFDHDSRPRDLQTSPQCGNTFYTGLCSTSNPLLDIVIQLASWGR